MKNAIQSYCTLILLGTGFAYSQSVTTGNGQMGTPTTSTMTSMRGDPATEGTLQKMEQELAQADAAHNTAPFIKYLDDNIIAFGPGWKATGKAEVLQGIQSTACTIKDVTLSSFSYKWITSDAVLLTYVMNQNGACRGKPLPAVEHVSSLWQKKSGNWVSVFHQGTAEEPSTPAPAA